VTVSLTGHREVAQLLADLPEKQIKPALRKVLRASAKPILTAAKLRAPRKSGAMAKSLTIRAFKRSRKQRIGFWIGTTQRGSAYGGKAFYAWFIEKGFKIGKRTREIRQAQDYARKLRRSPMKLRDELAASLSGANQLKPKQIRPRRPAVLTVDHRESVPGKFFIESAYQSKAEQAKTEIEQGMLTALRNIKKVS
jgi:hypothetical protein